MEEDDFNKEEFIKTHINSKALATSIKCLKKDADDNAYRAVSLKINTSSMLKNVSQDNIDNLTIYITNKEHPEFNNIKSKLFRNFSKEFINEYEKKITELEMRKERNNFYIDKLTKIFQMIQKIKSRPYGDRSSRTAISLQPNR
ncbi:TPA: hypothetical protein RJD83_002643 [Legionella pneumophila]|nr:hypothetical protein [Legionella pneumophila]